MACGAHTAVVAMGEDLEAGGAAPGSKLRSMFTDFEWFSSGVVGVGLEAARNGKKVVRSLPRASPPSRGPPRGPGTPTGVSGGTSGAAYTSPGMPDGSARSRFEISGVGKGLTVNLNVKTKGKALA